MLLNRSVTEGVDPTNQCLELGIASVVIALLLQQMYLHGILDFVE